MTKHWLVVLSALGVTACESLYREDLVYGDEDNVANVYAKVETLPVESSDDAADDPAIWYNFLDPEKSLILGTDKKAGLAIYNLDGELVQFIPAGLPNNVDLRQGLNIGGWFGDLAAASNRDGDVVTLFSINAEGGSIVGSFPAALVEPYGSCMGIVANQTLVFITYKTGEVQAHLLEDIVNGKAQQRLLGTIRFASQLEGCVFDDQTGVLYVGEEARGLWRTHLTLGNEGLTYSEPRLIDAVNAASGLVADVEGVSLLREQGGGYIVVSSQGNDSYAVYQRSGSNVFLGRFRVANNRVGGIDGSQETDGLAVDGRSFGSRFPKGLLVVQDGYNAPVGEAQNFKIVDWRDIADVLHLP